MRLRLVGMLLLAQLWWNPQASGQYLVPDCEPPRVYPPVADPPSPHWYSPWRPYRPPHAPTPKILDSWTPPWGWFATQSVCETPTLLRDCGPLFPQQPNEYTCWVHGEYLYWFLSGTSAPPLVTSGTAASLGIFGNTGTTTLFGNGNIGADSASGARVMLGTWFNRNQVFGFEAGGFYLFQPSNSFSASSTGTPLLARPFINGLTGAQASQLIASTGVVRGSVAVSNETDFYGAEANALWNVSRYTNPNGTWRVDFLAGPRFAHLGDTLSVREDVTLQAGTIFAVKDSFATANNFYGGQVGLRGVLERGRWMASAEAKVAFGINQENVTIAGSTTTNPNTATATTVNGGLLAVSSNIGSYDRSRLAFIPEASLSVGYHVTNQLTLKAGYNLMYWNAVVRPGEQIDVRVNPNLVPRQTGAVGGGAALPEFRFRETDFWAHGASLGIELRY